LLAVKIHLGCGQKYLQGYVNIDFSPSEHSVQVETVADQHADILELSYPANSIDEIRLHHVFEHFSRPVACALISGWSSWLKVGGKLHLEVPDFQKTARVILSPFTSFRKKAIAERHLFGSHEARWAIHCEGYTPMMLREMLLCFGYDIITVRKNSWEGTYNFEMLATRSGREMTHDDLTASAREYLGNYLLDKSEETLLLVWMNQFANQLERSWACNV
jgi:hypothetical protein